MHMCEQGGSVSRARRRTLPGRYPSEKTGAALPRRRCCLPPPALLTRSLRPCTGQDFLINVVTVKSKKPVGKGFQYLWPNERKAGEGEGFEPFSKTELNDAVKKGGKLVTLDEDGALDCALWMRDLNEAKHLDMARLRFLYEFYQRNCYWLEVFETGRRLMLTGGLIFFNPGSASQMVISMLICLFSMRVYAEYTPFIQYSHDQLAEMAQWQLFLTLFAALLVKVDVAGESEADKAVFGDVLAAMQVSMNELPLLSETRVAIPA